MPITVVVGGQFGSEGKGKVAHWFARTLGAHVAVRVGGPNSGHTVIAEDGAPVVFRHLPTAAILPDIVCVLPAGSYIVPGLLHKEMKIAGLPPERLVIDPNAVVITERDVVEEQESNLRGSIGSTQTGTGAAVLARVKRDGQVRFARNEAGLAQFVRPASAYLRERLEVHERVMLEGTQGFGLSVLHTPHYPYATSRDTTAAGFVAEAGLSPLDVDDVILVIRTFPIRVAGNSGPLHDEVTWQRVTKESGHPTEILEHTSVTKAIRRVGRFDPVLVRQAITSNAPTSIVLNHLDYVDSVASRLGHTPRTLSFLNEVQSAIGRPVSHFGLGPGHLASTSEA